MGDLLDPIGRRDRLGERGDLIADGTKALAELVEPLRRSGVLLRREALTDVGERQATCAWSCSRRVAELSSRHAISSSRTPS